MTEAPGVHAADPNPMRFALVRWGGRLPGGEFTVGGGPLGIVFDGAHIWVANGGSNNVTKLP